MNKLHHRAHWRFYASPEAFGEKTVTITDPDEVHHARDVMRVHEGDTVTVFNGVGYEFRGVITLLQKKKIEINDLIVHHHYEILRPRIVLVQALPKLQAMDGIIRMATEVGVDVIIPLMTERTIMTIPGHKVATRIKRWQRIAIASSKQSGRLYIPEISLPLSFDTWVAEHKEGATGFIATLHQSARSFFDQVRGVKTKSVSICIGPEGGFTQQEVAHAREQSCIPVALGPFALRSETAGTVAVAVMRAHFSPSFLSLP